MATLVSGNGTNGEVVSLIPEQVEEVDLILEQSITDIEQMASDLIAWDEEQYASIANSKYAYFYPSRYRIQEIERCQESFQNARKDIAETVDYITNYSNTTTRTIYSGGTTSSGGGSGSSNDVSITTEDVLSDEKSTDATNTNNESAQNSSNSSDQSSQSSDSPTTDKTQSNADDIIKTKATESNESATSQNASTSNNSPQLSSEYNSTNQLASTGGVNNGGSGSEVLNGTGSVVDSDDLNGLLEKNTGSLLSSLNKEDFQNSGAIVSSSSKGTIVPKLEKKQSLKEDSSSLGTVGVVAAGGTVTLGLGLAAIGGLRYYNNKKKKEEEIDTLDVEEEEDNYEELSDDEKDNMVNFKESLYHIGEEEEQF